eukprot:1110646-Prymnesium_polylepis.1
MHPAVSLAMCVGACPELRMCVLRDQKSERVPDPGLRTLCRSHPRQGAGVPDTEVGHGGPCGVARPLSAHRHCDLALHTRMAVRA